MTNDKMPKLLYVAVNVDENVPCDFVAHKTQIFTDINQPYMRADLCPKPEKIDGLKRALKDPLTYSAKADCLKVREEVIKAAQAYLKLTEEK